MLTTDGVLLFIVYTLIKWTGQSVIIAYYVFVEGTPEVLMCAATVRRDPLTEAVNVKPIFCPRNNTGRRKLFHK